MDAAGVSQVCEHLGLRHGGAYVGKYGHQMSISCFPAGTRVLTDTGFVPIEDVSVGSRVLTERSGFRAVRAVHGRFFSGDMVSVDVRALSRLPLTATADHRVPIIRAAQAKRALQHARDVHRKDRQGVPIDISTLDVVAERELVALGDVRVGDFVRVPAVPATGEASVQISVERHQASFHMPRGRGVRKSKVKIPTTIPVDARLAAFLGLWIAEGSVGGATGKADINFTNFTFARHEQDIVDECARIASDLFGLRACVYKYASRSSVTDVRVNDWLLARWFREIIGTGAANKRIPDFIMTAPTAVAKVFVDAYWRGDGERYDGDTASYRAISTVSSTVADQLPILLGRLGVACRVGTRAARTDGCGTRHRESYTVAWAQAQKYCAGKRFNGGMWYPVKAVAARAVTEVRVYNLTVAEDETFTVGPFAVKNCPLAPWNHDDPIDRNKSCSVLLNDDGVSYARCWSFSCQFKGTFFRLVQKVITSHKNPSKELVELLAWVAEVDDDSIERRVTRSQGKVSVEGQAERMVSPPRPTDRDVLDEAVFAPFAGKLPAYAVRQRGITVEAAKVWGLGHDVEGGRLVFSVRRSDGRLIGMTGRILPSVETRLQNQGFEPTKYHNYSGLNKSRYLYGTHTWTKGLPVVLVEGPVDAVRTWQALQPRVNVGATLGEGFGQDHRRTINATWPEEVFLFPDGDAAGRRMAEKVHASLKNLSVIRLMRCPVREFEDDETEEVSRIATDPGELDDVEILHAFKMAKVIMGKKIKW